MFDLDYFYCLEGQDNVRFYYSGEVEWCESLDCDFVPAQTECDWDSNADDAR